MKEVYKKALELSKPHVKPINVIMVLDKTYGKHGLIDHRVIGYLHGIGLQIEETPITPIISKYRFIKLKPGMVIALVHTPIML